MTIWSMQRLSFSKETVLFNCRARFGVKMLQGTPRSDFDQLVKLKVGSWFSRVTERERGGTPAVASLGCTPAPVDIDSIWKVFLEHGAIARQEPSLGLPGQAPSAGCALGCLYIWPPFAKTWSRSDNSDHGSPPVLLPPHDNMTFCHKTRRSLF